MDNTEGNVVSLSEYRAMQVDMTERRKPGPMPFQQAVQKAFGPPGNPEADRARDVLIRAGWRMEWLGSQAGWRMFQEASGIEARR
ncbi:MAG: hypothetical protein AB7E79_05090 [Rhodospirillaceae bacterium]